MSSDLYIVAYSYNDKFEIPERVAQALIQAKEKKLAGVKFGDQYYSASFMWIQPISRTQFKQLNSKQLKMAGDIAEWLARPIHELDWSDSQAVDYAMRLMRRCDYEEVKKIYRVYAAGAYPSAKRFLMEAKQLDPDSSSDLPALTSGD